MAFLDVLGFRSIVAGTNADAALKDYVNSVDRAVQTDKNDGLQYVIFSDSVIVNSFLRLLEACATLFGDFLRADIMVRGAIAHGTLI